MKSIGPVGPVCRHVGNPRTCLACAAEAVPESAQEHVRRFRHSVTESTTGPWRCHNCGAKSPLYDLTVQEGSSDV